jgi:Condensation domain
MARAIKYESERVCARPRSPWFLREIEPGTPGHRTAVALLFRSELDISALECAADALVARRAATFRSSDREPGRRNIGSTRAWLTETRDLEHAQLPAWLESAAYEPFDRDRCPLLRLHLYRQAADETVALVVAHHVIADFWSIIALVRELKIMYAEQKGRIPEPVAELTDFVRQYCWIGGSRVSAQAGVAADSDGISLLSH